MSEESEYSRNRFMVRRFLGSDGGKTIFGKIEKGVSDPFFDMITRATGKQSRVIPIMFAVEIRDQKEAVVFTDVEEVRDTIETLSALVTTYEEFKREAEKEREQG